MCWYIWWIRQQWLHDEVVPLIYWYKMFILSITACAKKLSPQAQNNAGPMWRKPKPRQLKLNVDASFYVDSCACSVGAVLRDYKGKFIATSSSFIPHVASVGMAGAMVMRHVLYLVVCTISCPNPTQLRQFKHARAKRRGETNQRKF
jgi:hypothetical protein